MLPVLVLLHRDARGEFPLGKSLWTSHFSTNQCLVVEFLVKFKRVSQGKLVFNSGLVMRMNCQLQHWRVDQSRLTLKTLLSPQLRVQQLSLRPTWKWQPCLSRQPKASSMSGFFHPALSTSGLMIGSWGKHNAQPWPRDEDGTAAHIT